MNETPLFDYRLPVNLEVIIFDAMDYLLRLLLREPVETGALTVYPFVQTYPIRKFVATFIPKHLLMLLRIRKSRLEGGSTPPPKIDRRATS